MTQTEVDNRKHRRRIVFLWVAVLVLFLLWWWFWRYLDGVNNQMQNLQSQSKKAPISTSIEGLTYDGGKWLVSGGGQVVPLSSVSEGMLREFLAKNAAQLKGEKGDKGDQGQAGVSNVAGPAGATGATGASGPSGVLNLSLGNGLSGSLASQILALSLVPTPGGGLTTTPSGIGLTNACGANQLLKWDGSAWVCGNDNVGSVAPANLTTNTAGVSIIGGAAAVLGSGASVDIASASATQTGLLTSGDWAIFNAKQSEVSFNGKGLFAQSGSVISATSCATAGQIMIWDGGAWACGADVDTDTQDLSLSGNTLSLVNGGSVNLSAYLDNTDALASLSCVDGKIVKRVSSAWACGDDTVLTESQVDAYANNNGYLTSEVDGSTTNEIQSLTWTSGTHILSISGGNTADLGSLLDNTDSQSISKTGNTLSISGNASTVDLASYLDNTDSQNLSRSGTTLTISGGNSIDLAPINTDSQNLSLTGTTLNISGGTGVNIASINTDVLAGLSCANGQVAKWNGTAWACANDTDTVLTEAQVDAYANNNGYLTGEVDGSTTNEIQTLSLSSDNLTILNGNSVSLAGYLDNTDALVALSCADGKIVKRVTGAWACGDDVDTQLSEAQVDAYVSNNGYLTSEGDSAVGNEVTNATTSGGLVRSGAGTTGDPYTLGVASSGITNAMLANSSLTVTAGTGLSGGGVVALGGTVTLSSTLGTSISTGELDDASVTFAKLAGNSCGTNAVMKFNGSAWICGTDSDTILSEATVESYIFDADNTGTLSSGTLALGSLSYTGTLGDTNISDALTISSSGSVADSALSSNVTKLGQTIESGEITDGTVTGTDLASATITFSNISQNSCTTNQLMKWNGTGWACASDATGGTVNSFETITTSSGTGPVADSSTDTLTLTAGSGVTITGDGTTDTITVAATLGADITSDEIVDGTIVSADITDGTIANAKLANSSVTVTAGTGLSGGGAVSLGGTVTLNAALGTDISSAEIVDGTIVAADITDGTITNAKLATSSLTVTAGTGLSGGGSVSLGGTVTLTSSLGTAIDTSEITDGTIATVDIANGAVTAGKIANCSSDGQILKYTTAGGWACASDADTTYSQGTGITINGSNVISSTLGTSISTGELDDASVTFAKLASNSCSTDAIMKFNGTAWYCGTDVDTQLSEAQVEAYIFDADNTGTLSSGTLALGSLSYTGTLGDTNVSDALTISSAGSVADGALSSNVSKLGQTIESGEITDGTVTGTDLASATIQFSNIAQNSCTTNQIMKWNGTAWACASDATGGTVNSFETITTSSGTSPVADSSTDTLTLSGGSGVTITGDGTTDTITVAATLGADITSAEIVDGTIVNADIADGTIANAKLANSSVTVTAGTGLSGGGAVSLGGTVTLNSALGTDINSAEIVDGTIVAADITDGTITNAKLAQSSLTVSAGNGLTTGGSVSLGGTTTLNIGAGNGITVNADDITVKAADSADAQSTTTSSGSGMEVLSGGVTLLQGCANGEILKWNEASDVWSCSADSNLTEAQVEAFIFDGDNTGTLSSGTLALGSLSYTGALTDTNISDTLTVGATSTVSDSALSSNVSKLGATIESSEITDGTVTSTDIADATIAAADVAADALDFTELKDSMTLDATTTIAAGAYNFTVSLGSTGDFIVLDGAASGTPPLFTVDAANDTVSIGSITDDSSDALLVLDGFASDPSSTIGGSMYYNTTNSKFRCYEGGWKDCITPNIGYSVNVMGLSHNPLDATTYYLGSVPRAPTTTATISKVYMPKAGTIKYISISVYCTTAGTNEAWPIVFRKNAGADVSIASVSVSATERIFTNSSLSTTVAAGDYIDIKTTTPTWATNPAGCTYGGVVYVE